MTAVTIFVVLFMVGYALPVGRSLRGRISRVGATAGAFDVRVVVGACLAVGLVAQVIALVLAGGPAEVFEGQIRTTVLEVGSPLLMHFLLGFSTIGLVIWAVWRRPVTRLKKVGFTAVALEIILFWSLAGTRTRVFPLFMLAIVSHHVWRPWARRTVVLGVVACVVLGAALLSVRQESLDKPLGSALLEAPEYVINTAGILNDFTEFDLLLYATSLIPEERSPMDKGCSTRSGHTRRRRSCPTSPGLRIRSSGSSFGARTTGGGGRTPSSVCPTTSLSWGSPWARCCSGSSAGCSWRSCGRLQAPGHRLRIGLYAVAAAIFYLALATSSASPSASGASSTPCRS